MKSVLKVELYKAGITQKEVAERLGLRTQAVCAKVNGKTRVTIDEAFAIQEMILEKTQVLVPLKELFPISNN